MAKGQLIGLLGRAGSGKDTVADAIIESVGLSQANRGIVRIAFADKLKDVVSDVYGIPRYYFDDRVLKNTPHKKLGGKTPRQAAQVIGTEGFRNLIDQNTWTNYAMANAREWIEEGTNVIITDIRFDGEFFAVKDDGYPVLHIYRDISLCEQHNHESERNIDRLAEMADRRIDNTGTIEDLKRIAVETAMEIFEGTSPANRMLRVA